MQSNLVGKECDVYAVSTSTIGSNSPSVSELKDIVIPAASYIRKFNYAIAVVQNSEMNPGRNFYLYDKPTAPTLPSNFNNENALKLDMWAPNWNLTSFVYIINDNYQGPVNTEECLSLFPNKLDLTPYVYDDSIRAILFLFENEFAVYFPVTTANPPQPQFYDLIANRKEGKNLFPELRFSNKQGQENFHAKTSSDPGNTQVYGWNSLGYATSGMNEALEFINGGTSTHNTNFIRYLDQNFVPPVPTDEDDPYGPGGTSGPGGGTGTFDGTSDPIDIPGLPTLSAVDTGFITLFNPTIGQLKNLASYMWSDLFSLDTFKKMFADPMDAILGLSIVPVAVPSAGGRQVVVGNIPTGVHMNVASTQYVSVDCGTLNVEEFWGAYLDYDPYTKCSIFLPYIGVHPIKTDDVMGKAVHVVYHVDILSGSCVAFVKCGDSVLYEFIGQLASSIPVTGDNFTNVINGVLNIAGSIGTMVATGGFSAPASVAKAGYAGAYQAGNMMKSGASMAQDVMAMKPEIEHSGSLSGTGGMLGNQTPYMILERPRQALPTGFNSYAGYPSHMTAQLGSLSGYTEVEHIHLENIPCTMKEADEIMAFLQNGVIL